jgi:hypothetical protein
MCLSRGVFEGGCAGVLVGSPFVHQFEGVADGGLEAAQRQAWRCPIDLGSHSAGVTLQCPGWWHSGGDGHTRPEVMDVMEETRPADLT